MIPKKHHQGTDVFSQRLKVKILHHPDHCIKLDIALLIDDAAQSSSYRIAPIELLGNGLIDDRGLNSLCKLLLKNTALGEFHPQGFEIIVVHDPVLKGSGVLAVTLTFREYRIIAAAGGDRKKS